jgi:hypothetical protein
MNKGKAALTGAASGAAAGAVLGPWGAAAGGVVGGLAGYFGAGDDEKAPSYDPNHASFEYGLGGSGSYASQESFKYNQRQQELQALQADAYNRTAPQQAVPQTIQYDATNGQQYLNGAGSDARLQQLQALGGIDRSNQALGQFAQGGSRATEGAIQQAADAGARQQFAMARAQPGGGGGALRQAAFNAAGIMSNAGATAAVASQQDRAQQLAALQGVQQGTGQIAGYSGQMRGADQSLAQVQAGQANYDSGALNQFRNQQQQLQYNIGQNNQNAALQTRGQNDAATLGFGAQAQGYDVMRNQLASNQLGSQVAYEQAKAQGAGIGSANFNAATQQNNAETGMMLGALSGAAGAYGQMAGGGGGKPPTSDVRAKTDIKPTSVLEALGGHYSPDQTRALYMQGLTDRFGKPGQTADAHDRNALYSGGGGFDPGLGEFTPAAAASPASGRDAQLTALSGVARAQPDVAALDAAYRREGGAPNLRPAQGYEYAYRDPAADGAGRYVGPMAQDLEHLPGVVEEGPGGKKSINAPRLTLANTAAVSEQQRRLDELERRQQLQALGGPMPPAAPFGAPAAPDYAALDAGYLRGQLPDGFSGYRGGGR